jgi:hypothetical protein
MSQAGFEPTIPGGDRPLGPAFPHRELIQTKFRDYSFLDCLHAFRQIGGKIRECFAFICDGEVSCGRKIGLRY